MPRIQLPVYQNNLADGGVNSGGFLHFYENRSDPPVYKSVYIDPAEQDESPNPVELDADGYTPELFGSGAYTVVATDQDGVQLWSRDDVVIGTSGGQFADYSPIQPYEKNAIVRAEDGQYYVSLFNQNVNHEPSISPEWWSRTVFLKYWNPDEEYLLGDSVIHGGVIWLSLQGGNKGNEPEEESDWWSATLVGMANPMTSVGDMIVGSAEGSPVRKAIGSEDDILTVKSGSPSWVNLRVSGDDDITESQLPNVSWMAARGMGGLRTKDAISLNQFFGVGKTSFYVTDADDGPSPAFTGYVEILELDEDDGYSLQIVTNPASGEMFVRSVFDGDFNGAVWNPLGSGSSVSNGIEPVNDLGSAATSDSETVVLNCSNSHIWVVSMDSANTTGTLTISLTNFPDTSAGVYVGHIYLIRGGRKTVNFSVPGGMSFNWIQGAAPLFNSAAGTFDLIVFRKELNRTRIKAMLIDGGTW